MLLYKPMTKIKTKPIVQKTCHGINCWNAHKHPLVWALVAFAVVAGLVWSSNVRGIDAALTVNTNVASLNAQRQLAKTQEALSKSFERLSSGLRINDAADDAAGLGVSEDLRAQVRALESARQNTAAASKMLTLTEDLTAKVNTAISNCLALAAIPDYRISPTKKRTDAAAKISELNNARAAIAEVSKAASRAAFTEDASESADTATKAVQTMNKSFADTANAISVYFGFGPRGKKISYAVLKRQTDVTQKAIGKGKQVLIDAATKINTDAEEDELRAEEFIRENEEDASIEDGTSTEEGDGTEQEESTDDTKDEGT